MRNSLSRKLLAALLVLAAPGYPALARETTSPRSQTIEVRGDLGPAVLQGDTLYALVGGKELVRIDLRTHKVSTVVRFPEGQTAYQLSVSGNKACAAARGVQANQFHVIDLAAGRIVRSLDGSNLSDRGLGFASDDSLYTVGGGAVKVIDIATGKIRHTIRVGGGVLAGSHRVGDRLYVAREYAGGLAIIDLAKGKLLDLIPTRDWLFQVQVVGDAAFVWGSFNGVGRIDLKTKKYEALKQPQAENQHHHYTLLAGPNKTLFLLGPEPRLYRYDVAGRLMGSTPLPGKAYHTLAGEWEGRAVLLGKDAVTLVRPAKPRT